MPWMTIPQRPGFNGAREGQLELALVCDQCRSLIFNPADARLVCDVSTTSFIRDRLPAYRIFFLHHACYDAFNAVLWRKAEREFEGVESMRRSLPPSERRSHKRPKHPVMARPSGPKLRCGLDLTQFAGAVQKWMVEPFPNAEMRREADEEERISKEDEAIF